MADYLLDTNILSYWYDKTRAEHANVLAHVKAARQPDPRTQYVSRFYVSVVTLGEIEYGHRIAPTPNPAEQAKYSKFVRDECPVVQEMTKHVAEQYGEMRAWLFENYSPGNRRSKAKRAEELVDPTTAKELGIDENDLWIAAQAKTHNFVLVTNDAKDHFANVLKQFAPTLATENWTR